jgi:hypothetical protein
MSGERRVPSCLRPLRPQDQRRLALVEQRWLDTLSDHELAEVARGQTQVDRAVRRYREWAA